MNLYTPPITKHLLIINVLMFLAKMVCARYGISMDDVLGLHFIGATDFRVYQFVTYMFVHGSFEHLFFNMFAVWMFGRIMEQVMGAQRFLLYYMVCGIGAGLSQELAQGIEFYYSGLAAYDAVTLSTGAAVPMADYLNEWTTVGASGAVYGVLLAFGMTFPEERMFIIPFPFPIKAKWFVMGYAVIELMSALGHRGDGVAHVAHLGGMLFGLVMLLHWRRHGGSGGRFFGGGSTGYGGGGTFGHYYTPYEDVSESRHSGPTLLQRVRQRLARWRQQWQKRQRHTRAAGGEGAYDKHADERAYRQRAQEREAEVDRILAKVKKGGYESLTAEEKRTLFDASQR